MKQELPSEVLIELREKTGRERRDFAELTGYSYATQRRLEEDTAQFRRHHLDALAEAGWLKQGDEWWSRFENAIAYQVELDLSGVLSGNGHEPDARSQENGADETNQEIPAKETDTEPIKEDQADETVKTIVLRTATSDGLGVPAVRDGAATAADCARQIARVRGMTDLAKAAMDQVSSTHTRAEEVVASTLAVVELFSDAIDDASKAASHTRLFHEQRKHGFLRHVGKIVEDSDARTLSQLEEGADAVRRRSLRERVRDFFRDC
jgi:transcriptional regulator with XRE-family HTH domain